MKKIHGFTLAEVLIALTIIGIISAITVPAIIVSANNHEYKTGYRKAYSDLSNATLKGIAFGEFPLRETKFDTDTGAEEWEGIKSQFVVEKLCEDNNLFDCWVDADKLYSSHPLKSAKAFVDSSGRVWVQYNLQENIYLVDINGDKPPNHFGKDRWGFTFADNEGKRICSEGAGGGDGAVCSNPSLPYKVTNWPSSDYDKKDSSCCNYPPCLYYSWLY